MEKWTDLTERLKKDKPAASAVFSLVYMGAFDYMLPDDMALSDKMKHYEEMCNHLRDAFGSKAKLAKGYKNDAIGLIDVKNVKDLIKWRRINNPISKADLVTMYSSAIRSKGFTEYDHEVFPFRRPTERSKSGGVAKPPCYITTKPQLFLHKYVSTDLMYDFENGSRVLYIFLEAEETTIFNYGADKSKTAMKINGYTGDEPISDMVVWPKWGTEHVPSKFQMLKKGVGTLIQVKPYLKKTEPELKVVDIILLEYV